MNANILTTESIGMSFWNDVVSLSADQFLAENALRMAHQRKLLIEDGECAYVPTERDGQWILEGVLTVDGVAEFLGMDYRSASRLLEEMKLRHYFERDRFIYADRLWSKTELESALVAHAAERGLTERQAAHELGLTMSSYRSIVGKIRYESAGKVLPSMLDAFLEEHLPGKVWNTRTSKLCEFVRLYNRKNSSSRLELQWCEVDNCDEVSLAQCENPQCRGSDRPRFICGVHSVWLDLGDMFWRPPSLCPSCADLVRCGKLQEFVLL
ncbi:MAG: hypothetical protein FWD57_09170 [Polyangiaceae bacterium]|nr:hypothetical protein [Polyangiaceae bacterium]